MTQPARDATFLRVVLITTVVGLAVLIVAPSRPSTGTEAREFKARVDVDALAKAVNACRSRQQRVPPSLRDLLPCDANGQRCIDELCIDPWDREYELHGDHVVSAGPNGVFGDDDDVAARAIMRR